MEQELIQIVFSYIRPELLIILISAYALGYLVKRSKVSDRYIILVVLAYSIIMSAIMMIHNGIQYAIVNGIIQGLLITMVCVFSNQLPKQLSKKE